MIHISFLLRRLACLCVLLAALGFLPLCARAATFRVNNTSDSASDNGVCSASAPGDSCTLREAINAANADDSPDVIDLTYASYSNPTFHLDGELTITHGVTISCVTNAFLYAAPNSRIFNISDAGNVTLHLLSLHQGSTNSGGAILSSNTNLTLAGCVLGSNTASQGGALSSSNGNLTLASCRFNSNSATDSGGAIFSQNTSTAQKVTMSNCTFDGNTSDVVGGAVYVGVAGGGLEATNCTFSSNSVALNKTTVLGGGGAIYNVTGPLKLTQCTLSSNTASNLTGNSTYTVPGGAIYNGGQASGQYASPLTLTNCTITSNSADNGGGVCNENGVVTLSNTILAGNSAPTNPDLSGTATTLDHSLLGGDPKLGPLRVHGAITATRIPLPGSPAIDQGNSTLTPDQNGVTRPIDDPAVPNASDGNGSDIGAVEYDSEQSGPNFVVNSTDGNADGACGVRNCTLPDAINAANSNPDASVITFDPQVFARQQTINFYNTNTHIDGDISIVGPTAQGAGVFIDTYSGDFYSPTFSVDVETHFNISFSNLTFSYSSPLLRMSGSNALIQSCAFTGSAVAVKTENSASATLRNCTFSGEISGYPSAGISGLEAGGQSLSVQNCTISGYRYQIYKTSGTLSVSNSILNANPNYSNSFPLYGTIDSGGYNLLGSNARLSDLSYNGGPTLTMAPVAGSPAIDAGDPAFNPASLPYDQRGPGYGRVQNGRIDIGAFEVQTGSPIIASIAIDNASPKTNDILTAQVSVSVSGSNALTTTYQWLKNGSALPGETNKTLDLSKTDNGNKGDKISVIVIASSGTQSETATSDAVTIVNSAPIISAVTLSPDVPYTNDVLKVSGGVATDADGDPLITTYQWQKNGVSLPGETSSILNLSLSGNGDKGDVISVIVGALDGTTTTSVSSPSVTIANSAPVLHSVKLQPSSAQTNDPLTITASASDDDGDALSYTFKWTKRRNGKDTVIRTQTTSTPSDTLQTAGSAVVAGDLITIEVMVSDGSFTSSSQIATALIGNTPVSIAKLTLTPTSAKTNTVLVVNAQLVDADGGRSSNTYVWTRTHAGQTREVLRETTNGSQSRLDLSKAGIGDKGDTITVTLTASDGQSSATKSASVTVGNSLPTLSGLKLSPTSATIASQITATFTASDLDVSDGVDSFKYLFSWKAGSKALSAEKGATVDLSKYKFLKAGDTLSLQLRIGDGTAISSTQTATVKLGAPTSPTKPSAGGS